MSSAGIRERFDELIKLGKTLLPYQNNLEYLAKKEKWETQCQVLLERAFGKGSVYLEKFQAIMMYANEEAPITYGISLMEGAKEELDLEKKSDKLDKVKREIEEEKAEAERRAAVVETKLWGSVIEVIDMLREELKRRSQMDQEITEIRKEIGELKLLLTKLIPDQESR